MYRKKIIIYAVHIYIQAGKYRHREARTNAGEKIWVRMRGILDRTETELSEVSLVPSHLLSI